ncbi:hypothetical protein HPB51_013132 [Rhipicephalus microplus]|uniref:Uncharacterized protein n=1 Tax=Rhipicephalus microplus TaxID=6941 RepID=A0A9J6EGN6_RHIMP|nr:hypothetical protein HPB51_013132 [Rhipicephalus microplus]
MLLTAIDEVNAAVKPIAVPLVAAVIATITTLFGTTSQPPYDAVRGYLFHAYDDFSDEEILADLQASTITFLLVKSCLNCRKVGHRTDVCLMPRKQRCHRCGQKYPPRGQGETPTCTPRCIVCNGAHNIGSTNYQYRFIKKVPPTPQLKQEAQEPTWNTHRNRFHSGPSSSRSPSPRDHSEFFAPLGNSSSQPQHRESRSPFYSLRSGFRSAKRRDSRCRSQTRCPKLNSAQRRESRPSSHCKHPRSKSDRHSTLMSRSSSRGAGEASKSVAWQWGPQYHYYFPIHR